MRVVYDDVRTLSFYGELKADIAKDVTFGIDGTFSSYANDVQREVWNLPDLKLNAKFDFTITPKWYAGVNAFYVGNRKDQKINTELSTLIDQGPITLAGYLMSMPI